MQVILAAMGGGAPGTMTAECAGALAAAECVVGARRLLAALPAGCTARRVEAARPQEVLQAVLEARQRKACGPVAPPDGLYFMRVDYAGDFA